MAIRPLDSDRDLDAVMEIWLESNADAHAFIPRSHWESESGSARQSILSADVIVFEDEPDGIAGFASISDDRLEALFVRVDRRGQGVGRMLLDEAKAGRNSLDLDVYIQNPRAFSFFKREGFDQHGVASDPATFKMRAMMRWSRKAQPFEMPENLEEALAPIREEAGESIYQKILEDIRNGNFNQGGE